MKFGVLLIIIPHLILSDHVHHRRQWEHTKRIIGGRTARIENYPFMASVIIKSEEYFLGSNRFSGGASIISPYWVATAAHCVYDFNHDLLASKIAYVRSNTTYLNEDVYARDHLIIQCLIHEDYKNKDDSDIALLQVDAPFDGVYEIPVAYARRNYTYVPTSTVTTLGWGTTKAGKDVTPFTVSELRSVDVNLVQEETCRIIFRGEKMTITSQMVCAGAPGKDACINDSGGPLVQYDEQSENLILVGIVSWGIDCASIQFPGVYTKVSEFDRWISTKLETNHGRPTIPDDYYIQDRRQFYYDYYY